MLDAWDYLWTHRMAKLAGPWHGCTWQVRPWTFWERRSGWHLLDEELRLTLGGFWDACCWHFAPDIVRIANPRRCLEPDESHVSCVFEDPFLRMARAEGMIPREGAAMCSWACGGMLFQSVPLQFSIALLSSCIGFTPVRITWTPSAHVSGFCNAFMLCICF